MDGWNEESGSNGPRSARDHRVTVAITGVCEDDLPCFSGFGIDNDRAEEVDRGLFRFSLGNSNKGKNDRIISFFTLHQDLSLWHVVQVILFY